MVPGLSKYISDTEGVEARVKKFEVFEVPKHIPSGKGRWYWVLFEKSGKSTLEAVKEIAIAEGIDSRDIGYAGIKDKHARTVQWLSLPSEPRNFPFKIYAVVRNERKLKVGTLWGNWFRIVLETDSPGEVVETVYQIKDHVPNGFGPQRFGRINHIIGEMLVKGRKREAIGLMKRHRIPLEKRYFILMQDSFKSLLFNEVLDMRIPLTQELEGDILGRYGPTGPIYGRKVPLASGFQGEIERSVLEKHRVELSMFKGKGRRRALFVPLLGLKIGKRSGEVELRFFLPKGSYATMVLREIMKENFTWPSPSFSSSSS